MVQTYVVDETELLKLLLHAAKYPANSVNGVLVGTVDASSSRVSISTIIPLLHTSISLAPALEIGLAQVGTSADAWVITHPTRR